MQNVESAFIILLLCFVYLQVDQQQSTDNRVSQMFDLTFRNTSGDEEKRKQVHKC